MGPLELLIVLLFLGLPVLVIVLIVRGVNGRSCPQCGKRVKKGLLECGHCGYDFRRATAS